jgi:hypothetical protein
VNEDLLSSIIRRRMEELTWSRYRAGKSLQQSLLSHRPGRSCETHICASDPSPSCLLYIMILINIFHVSYQLLGCKAVECVASHLTF